MKISIEVKPYRKKFALFAGKSRLSPLYKTKIEALKELNNNVEHYRYWADSTGVSIENKEPIFKNLDNNGGQNER
jgi:hypothetical protein